MLAPGIKLRSSDIFLKKLVCLGHGIKTFFLQYEHIVCCAASPDSTVDIEIRNVFA
jgi:hypothetical protein